jgi:hypothetical protein
VSVFLNNIPLSNLLTLCSHIFGTVSDLNDLDGGHIAADNDIEDEYETIRRQRSEKCARIDSQRSQSLEV